MNKRSKFRGGCWDCPHLIQQDLGNNMLKVECEITPRIHGLYQQALAYGLTPDECPLKIRKEH